MSGEHGMGDIDRAALAAEGWTISDGTVPAAFLPGGDPKSFAPRIEVVTAKGERWPVQWSRNAHWGDVFAWRAV